MRTSKGYLLRVAKAKETITSTCIFTETQRQVEDQESFCVKKGRFPVCPDGSHGHREL